MKATVTQVYKRISITPSRTDGILNYDIDNAYPQRIIDIVNNSGMASTCVKMKIRFLMGGGFADSNFSKQKVNSRGLTADKLLRKVCTNMSYLPLLAFQINYNALFQKTEINYIPFSHVRLTDIENKEHPDMVALYDDWERVKKSRIDKDKIDYVHFYNPDPIVIQEQVDDAGGWDKYKGQVFFYAPNGVEYPLSDFDSVLEDMQTDSKTKSFKFRNITTNFMASHILITDKIENDGMNEATEGQFLDSLEQFQGADDALRMLHIERQPGSDPNSIELKKVDIQNVENLYQYTESSVKDNIILSFLQPKVLLFPTPGKLGTSSEIIDAVAYYNGITYHERLIIEEIFTELFKNFATNINATGNYSIIPFKAPVAESVDSNIMIPLSNILVDPVLTPQQKQNILVVVFKLTPEDAQKIMGGTITSGV